MVKMVRALTVNLGTPMNTEVPEKSAFQYLGHMIYATTPTMIDECCHVVNQINDQSENSAIFSNEEKDNARAEAYAFFGYKQEDMYTDTSVQDRESEIEVKEKKKRVQKPVSPLHTLLPQVFKKTGKVVAHPFNGKRKSKDAREVMRKSIYFASCDTVLVSLPVGTCELSLAFKDACVNSQGESIFDFVLEEMMMQGWTIRGVKFDKDENGNRSNPVQVE